MKHSFLLDESALLKAVRGLDRHASQLWLEIFRRCHRLVFSGQHALRFWGWLGRSRGPLERHPLPLFPTCVRMCLTNKDKWTAVVEENVFEELFVRHENDKFLARMAVRCQGCIVVTTDRKTKEDFERPEFSEQYNIRAATIEEALSLAKAPG